MKRGIVIGSFDVMHPGYIRMLNTAANNCDYLYVALHVENKAKPKPILSVEERKEILLSLKAVDEVIPYLEESDLYNLLVLLKPDIRFLGSDYRTKGFTGDDLDIELFYIDRSHGWSATKFKRLIYESFK